MPLHYVKQVELLWSERGGSAGNKKKSILSSVVGGKQSAVSVTYWALLTSKREHKPASISSFEIGVSCCTLGTNLDMVSATTFFAWPACTNRSVTSKNTLA